MTNSEFVLPENYFKTRFKFSNSRQQLRPIIARYFQKFIPKDSAILELAFWYGDFINNIQWSKKFAIEINTDSLNYLQPWVTGMIRDIAKDNRSDYFVGSNVKLDCIFASNFFEHLDDEQLVHVMSEIKKCLKPLRVLMLMQPNYYYFYREYFDDFTHKKVFSHASLYDFLESQGMNVRHMEKKFLPWNFKKNFLPVWIAKICLSLYFKLPFRIWGQMLFISSVK